MPPEVRLSVTLKVNATKNSGECIIFKGCVTITRNEYYLILQTTNRIPEVLNILPLNTLSSL